MAILWIMQIIFTIIVKTHGNIKVRDCEPIEIDACKSLGYNYTAMPNLVGHYNQEDAEFQLSTFTPLIKYGCSRHLQFFLCSVYVPMCTEKLFDTLGPCKPMCELVKTSCEPVLNEFGFPWPRALNCSKFPEKNDDTTMCMMPDAVTQDGGESMTVIETGDAGDVIHLVSQTPTGKTHASRDPCAHFRHGPDKYIYNNQTIPPGCVLRCGEDDLFSREDKKFANIFIAIFSIACLVLTLFAVVTFLIDAERPSYAERLIVLIAFCYMACSVAYLVRLGIGRDATICETDHHSKERVLVTDGLQNPNCVIIFLLLYYFGSASHLWWVVFALTWFLVAGLKWSYESVHTKSTWFHVAAWGIPAIKTVLVLLLRYIDTDELTGLCYVGNRNRSHLIAFVIVPLLVYLFLGMTLFVAGLVGLFRNRRLEQNNCGKTERIDTLLVKICIFSLVYGFASGCVIGCYIYEFANMEQWLSAHEIMSPNIEIFMLKIVSFLVPGFAAGIWAWNKNTEKSWKNFYRRACGCHGNQNKSLNTTNTSFPQIQYHQPPQQFMNTYKSMNNSYNLNSSYNSYYTQARVPSLSPDLNNSMDSNYKKRALLDVSGSVM